MPPPGRQFGAAGISAKSAKRLWVQLPCLLALCAFAFFRTFLWPSESTLSTLQDSKTVERQLLVHESQSCSLKCGNDHADIEKEGLNSEFIMLGDESVLKYRDPQDCDELVLPGDDDSDDEDCILEIGQGRRRRSREEARSRAARTGREECINDDRYERDDKGKCQNKGVGQVCVRGGAKAQVSVGAVAVLRTDKIGWIAFYIFVMFYMFVALAIVCDEYFVPALECFVDEFNIPMDVAGATFMAAGGSMPELCTSFIATFQETEVGFVAIVGSAVFNVLFVIAVCALFAAEPLLLTWWPLLRDCAFYVIALVTVAIVFSVSTPNQIDWWEAVILLLEYVAYCTFMAFNQRAQAWVQSKLPGGAPEDSPIERSRSSAAVSANPHFLKPSTFRAGLVQLLTRNLYLYQTAGIAAVTQIKGELRETFDNLDTDKDGKLEREEIAALLNTLGLKNKDAAQIDALIHEINRSTNNAIEFEDFKHWYIASECRIDAEVHNMFDKFDRDKSGTIEQEDLVRCLQDLGHKPTEKELQETLRDLHGTKGDSSGSTKVTFAEFKEWYQGSMFYGRKKESNKNAHGDEQEGGLNLNLAENPTACTLFWYVFTYPLCAVLFVTLPDVRTPKYQRNAKVAVLEFVLSLVWIAVFSNLLYESLVIVSNTLKIPVAVSAVTFLAAGTSIPDLLSSYVVARNGQGDMAVSSSIGSNIFDVTVGLPLPWIAYTIVKWKSFNLGAASSKGLFPSLLLLTAMLMLVISTIMCFKWRLTRGLGAVMMVFYVIYVVQYLLQKLPANCNVNEIGVIRLD